MILSIIVAVSENNVIGKGGDLPWRLSADLRRFKAITMGHAMIMGRKTYESIGRALPGRTTIVLTRESEFEAPGCLVATSFDQALGLAGDATEVFIVGGSQIYELALPRAGRIYWTAVHTEVKGDVFFPDVDWSEWELREEERHSADDKNQFEFSFRVFQKR